MRPRAALPWAAWAACAATSALAADEGQRVQVQSQPIGEAEQRRDAIGLTTVVGRDELDRYGDFNVLDVLQRQAGITVDGEQPRMRGLGGGYTQILINGEPAPPGFSLEQLAPAEVERIEIVKGPSAEFGGVAGTINVVLRVPPRLRQREWRGNLAYRAVQPVGSTSLSWGDRVGSLGFQLPISVYRWANGGDSRVERLSRTPTGEVAEQRVTGGDRWQGGGVNLGPRLDWRLDDTDTLQWQAFLQGNESHDLGWHETLALQGTPPSVLDDRSTRWGRWRLARGQLQWVRRRTDGLRIELKAGVQRSHGASTLDYVGLVQPGGAASLARLSFADNRELRRSAGARLRFPLAEGHVLAAGWDIERRERDELRRVIENGVEWLTGSVGRPFDAQLDRSVGFVQDEWAIGRGWSALLGLRAERLRTRASGIETSGEQRSTLVAPVAQLRWALDDSARDVVRASVARTSRLPDLSSLMGRYSLNGNYERTVTNTPIAADSAGNPALAPERAWAFELAVERTLPGGGVLSVGLFRREIDGLIRRRIALESVPEASVPRWVSRPVNFGGARSSGLEFELKGRARDLLPGHLADAAGLQLRAAMSLYRSSVEQIDDPDARLEGQPPWTLTLGLDRPATPGALGFGVSAAYTPAFSTQQTDLQRIWRAPVRRLEGYLQWRPDLQTQWRLAVNNVLPVAARSVSSIEDLDGFTARSSAWREPRTQVQLSLVLRF